MILFVDSETHLFRPGLAVPPPVCFSFARPNIPRGYLLKPNHAAEFIGAQLDAGTILGLHHAPFDLAVAAEYHPALLPKIFAALEKGQIRDTKTRQQLADIHIGRRKNPNTKKKEVWRPEADEGRGAWLTPEYTLAGSAKVKGSTGLAGLYLGKDRSADKGEDAWRMRYAELEHLPFSEWPAEAVRYAEEDAEDTRDVYLAQHRWWQKYVDPTLDVEAPFVDEIAQCRASFCLKLISAWGLRADASVLDELKKRCEKVAEEVRRHLFAPRQDCEECAHARQKDWYCEVHGLFRYQGPKKEPRRKIVKDTKAIQAKVLAAFTEAGLEVPRNKVTESALTKAAKKGEPLPEVGSIKTDKDTLELSGDEELLALVEAGPADSVRRTFEPALREGVEVPVNTYYDEMLDNGRISSSAPNLNNIPRGEVLMKLIGMDVRSAVIPRAGFVFCSIDFDADELRSHAEVMVELYKEWGRTDLPVAAKFFQDNPKGDPYLVFVADRLGITYEEAVRRKKAKDEEVNGMRRLAKPVLLGCPGGMGPAKLVESARKSYGVKFTLKQAKQFREEWKQSLPEMRRYLDFISAKTEEGTFDVKQLVSGRVRGKCSYADGANTYWSGLSADANKHCLWLVIRECYLDLGTPLYGSRVVGYLYDELILELPADIAHEAAERATHLMIEGKKLYLRHVPASASPALMTRWLKAAEAKYVDGRLVPWDS